MAWALRICTTIFSRRCAPGPGARLTSPTHLGLSPAGGRVIGMPLVSSRWKTTLTASNAHPPRATDDDGGGQALMKAVVGVVVASCDGEPPHDVYGSVTATTTTASGEPLLSHRLFDKVKGEPVSVPQGTAIPLLMERISAPLCVELKVSASLRDVNNAYYSGDHEIADGSVFFTPSLAGTDTAVIPGSHGQVRVDVTWSSV